MSKVVSFYILENNGQILLASRKNKEKSNIFLHFFASFVRRNENFREILCFRLSEIKKTGLTIKNSQKRGILRFMYPDREPKEIHVYTGVAEGEPKEIGDLSPQWFRVSEVPYKSMQDYDEYWLPFLLSGKNFRASFHLDENRRLLRQRLEKVESF